jgi:hypothetical protein
MRDVENCGSCGSRCGTGENCYDGVCIAACPGGFTDCSGTCKDLDSDRFNCGACENECGPGLNCEAGSCVPTCVSPLIECAGTCVNTDMDPANCGSCGAPCAMGEACVSGTCQTLVDASIGTAMKVDGTWIPVDYRLCGSGSPGACDAATARTSCSGVGLKVVSHASNGTTDVYDLGATDSCMWSISYFTVVSTMPSYSCLVGISNLEWTTCCGTTRWHGNTIAFGSAGAIFGYVYSSSSGYVSTYPNVSGATWGCNSLTTAASNYTGCTEQYVACTPP